MLICRLVCHQFVQLVIGVRFVYVHNIYKVRYACVHIAYLYGCACVCRWMDYFVWQSMLAVIVRHTTNWTCDPMGCTPCTHKVSMPAEIHTVTTVITIIRSAHTHTHTSNECTQTQHTTMWSYFIHFFVTISFVYKQKSIKHKLYILLRAIAIALLPRSVENSYEQQRQTRKKKIEEKINEVSDLREDE